MNVGAKPPLRDDAPIDPMDLRWDDDDDDVESETTEVRSKGLICHIFAT